MPRIRKKTSNRISTNERKKIQHKVRESRRKSKKAAKKNPQWKSKKPKDPGIPNNFPFKHQILAELSEQQNSKREKAPRESNIQSDEFVNLRLVDNGIDGISAKTLSHGKVLAQPTPAPIQEEGDSEEEEGIPAPINHDIVNLRAVFDEADVIIEVLDARDPLSFRSSHLEELSASKPGRKILLVLNKIDMCPYESVVAWATYLRTQHPTALFRSAAAFLPVELEPSVKVKNRNKATARVDDALGVDAVLGCLGEWAQAKLGDQPLAVAVLGVSNVGKSSFINSLLRRSVLPVYAVETASNGPTTTELPQEIHVQAGGREIRLIDTPGLSWEIDEAADNRNDIHAHDILLRSKGRIDRLKDPTFTVTSIVSRASTEDLMVFYNLSAFAKGDSTSFLSGLARSKQLIKKAGKLDLIGASRILLRDWSTGKLARFTIPPKSSTKELDTDVAVNKLYEGESAILETLLSRKEMRKEKGIVKLLPGAIECRNLRLEEAWLKEKHISDNADEPSGDGIDPDEDEDESEGESESESDESEDESEDEDEGEREKDDEDDEVEAPTPKKRKGTRMHGPLAKRVTFEVDSKTIKQSRKVNKRKAPEKPTAHVNAQASVAGKRRQKIANIISKSHKVAANVMTPETRNDEAYDFNRFF